MSGGSLDYLAYKMNDELFRKCDVHYSNVSNPNETTYARSDDPFEDRDISELVFDVGCIIHALEWYKSGDICEETYREVLSKFKKSYFLEDVLDSRVCKKAFELACDDIFHSDIPCNEDCEIAVSDERCSAECIALGYLKKARNE